MTANQASVRLWQHREVSYPFLMRSRCVNSLSEQARAIDILCSLPLVQLNLSTVFATKL